MLEPIIIYGILFGSIYALLALGLTLIYGVSGIVNMAHGAFYMMGAYFFVITTTVFSTYIPLGSPNLSIVAILSSLILTGIVGSIFYRLFLHQVVGDEIAILVVSICGGIVFQQLVTTILGSLPYPVPLIITGIVTIWGVRVSNSVLLASISSWAFLLALWLFVAKTKVGKAMKALSQDIEAGMLMGINRERTYMLTTAISAGLAGIAGILIISSAGGSVTPELWLHPLATSFSIVVLGGLGSIKGTLAGGFIFGFAVNAVAISFPQGGVIIPAVPFIILVLTMIFRPKGIFGKRIEMED